MVSLLTYYYRTVRKLERIRDGYIPAAPLLKEIALELGVRTSGRKAMVLQACFDAIREKRQQMIDASWRRNTDPGTPEIVVTTDKLLVRMALKSSDIEDLCSRYSWDPYGNIMQNGVPENYAYDVMFATGRNKTAVRTRRRMYFIAKRGAAIVGFAETRDADQGDGTLHLTVMCGRGGIGQRLLTAIADVARTMGYRALELDPSTEKTAGMWQRAHGFRPGRDKLLVRNVSANGSRVHGIPAGNARWTSSWVIDATRR